MYRLALNLPMDVVLVTRKSFETKDDAMIHGLATLPHGFEAIPEDQINFSKATIIPMKEKTVNTNELLKYREASQQPIRKDDDVFVRSIHHRCKVLQVGEGTLIVQYEEYPLEIPLSDAIRLPSIDALL